MHVCLSSGLTVSEAEEDLIQEAVASEPTLDPLMLRPGPCTVHPWVDSCGCCQWLFTASLTSFLCFTPHSGFSSHKLGKGSSGSSRSELIPQVKGVKHPRMTDLCRGAGVRQRAAPRGVSGFCMEEDNPGQIGRAGVHSSVRKKIWSRKMLEILMGEPVVGGQQAPDCCTARPPELQRRRHRRLEHSHFPSRVRQGTSPPLYTGAASHQRGKLAP